MQEAISGVKSIRDDAVAEFDSVTRRRDSAKEVVDASISLVSNTEKTFSEASTAFEAANSACSKAKATADEAAAELKSLSQNFDARKLQIEQELSIIGLLRNKVSELQAINLQESSGADAARSDLLSQTDVLINSLQTLHPQDHSLTEAVQLFRNHQELQPILDKLNELDAKLRAELQTLIDKLDASKSASAQTRSDASTICERVELKRLERQVFVPLQYSSSSSHMLTHCPYISSNAVAALNAATAQRDEAQLLFNSMQTLWTTTRTKTESALQT
jgi:hypothetical protein